MEQKTHAHHRYFMLRLLRGAVVVFFTPTAIMSQKYIIFLEILCESLNLLFLSLVLFMPNLNQCQLEPNTACGPFESHALSFGQAFSQPNSTTFGVVLSCALW